MKAILKTEKLCKTFSNEGLQQHVIKNLDLDDMQCEGSRAFFTADLIDLFDDPAPFIEAAKEIFKSPDIDDVKNEVQYLSDLLIEYGQWKTVLNKYFSLWKKIKDTPYSHLMERSSHLLSNVEYLAIKLVSDKTWKVAGNIVKDMGAWYLTLEDDAKSVFTWFYGILEDQFGEDETRRPCVISSTPSPRRKTWKRPTSLPSRIW